jgi:hypothetical protein
MGTSLTHTVDISGNVNIGKNLLVSGLSEFSGNITIPDVSKIGSKNFFEYTNLSFESGGIQLKSFKDIVLTLDADDAIDAESTLSSFIIKNGSNLTVASISESGTFFVSSEIIAPNIQLDSHLVVGSSNTSRLEEDKLEVQNSNFTIKLDSNNNDPLSALIVTRDGDLGTSDLSTNIILKASSTQIIAGSKVQTRGVAEVGYFGIKFYSDNAGGKFQGVGVNFKSKMLNAPSSITLSIDPLNSSNYNNVTITDVNEYGFFVECDSITLGHVVLKGTYTTVGN